MKGKGVASFVALFIGCAICVCLVAYFGYGIFMACAAMDAQRVDAHEYELEVNDTPAPSEESEGFVFNYNKDMQLPELPTGCEATALSTCLRMNGIDVSKTEVADAMPKCDGEDFVNEFWGDPFSEYGWACMAPCVEHTARRFCPVGKTPVDVTGTPLVYLPTPCVVWVTMELKDPIYSEYEQDGYSLLWNTHCVTLVAAGEATVKVIDPLCGMQEYPFSKFNNAYMANGCQAVYIADRGYAPLN